MDEIYRIEDLAPDEFAELLAEHGAQLSEEQSLALRQLILELGGVETAQAAVEMLTQLGKAA